MAVCLACIAPTVLAEKDICVGAGTILSRITHEIALLIHEMRAERLTLHTLHVALRAVHGSGAPT